MAVGIINQAEAAEQARIAEPLRMAEGLIAQGLTMTGRKCGSCSMCCLLLDVPAINKPKDKWCPHCRPGNGGCTIYDNRPEICRGFACMWLVNPAAPEYWAPQRAKMVLDISKEKLDGNPYLRVHVHPQYPNRWREQPYYADIKQFARNGLIGAHNDLKGSPSFYKTVIITQFKWSYLVLPHKEVPFGPGVVLRTGEDSWQFIRTKSDEATVKFGDKLTELQERVRRDPDFARAFSQLIAKEIEK